MGKQLCTLGTKSWEFIFLRTVTEKPSLLDYLHFFLQNLLAVTSMVKFSTMWHTFSFCILLLWSTLVSCILPSKVPETKITLICGLYNHLHILQSLYYKTNKMLQQVVYPLTTFLFHINKLKTLQYFKRRKQECPKWILGLSPNHIIVGRSKLCPFSPQITYHRRAQGSWCKKTNIHNHGWALWT